MRIALCLALLGIVGCTFAPTTKSGQSNRDTASFASARPVWLEGREKVRNPFVGYRTTVDGQAAEKAVVRLTGSTI
jgi:hypothetical protein